mgnify:FL=1
MNVLSLFDGLSCGMIALERACIPVINYFASEIDKYAIKVSEKNYPNIIRLGDVTKVTYKEGVLYSENGQWNVGKIDLVLAGSPCQGFSLAGKQLAFNDERSKLYFEFERILKEVNPKHFLLENVKMKQEYKDFISERLGVTPVAINSKVVSAQSRGREYWTNISFTQPVNKCITVKDVLDNYSGNAISADDTTKQLNTLLSTSKYSDNYSWCYDTLGRILVTRPDGLKIQRIGRIAFGQHQTEIVTCVTTPYVFDGKIIRKVTPEECEKLQTVPVGYTSCVSDSQRYKMLGNGWTVDVIAHILREM